MPNLLTILAGGENSRLLPLSSTAYKGFVPIHNQTMVERQVLRGRLCGIEEFVVVTDGSDPALEVVGEATHNQEVRFLQLEGTTGRKVDQVAKLYPTTVPLLVCLADTFARVDLNTLEASANAPGVDSAMCLARYRLPFGSVTLDDAERVVQRFEEKPILPNLLVSIGYYALGPAALTYLRSGMDLNNVLALLARESRLAASEVVDTFTHVDSLIDLSNAHVSLAGEM